MSAPRTPAEMREAAATVIACDICGTVPSMCSKCGGALATFRTTEAVEAEVARAIPLPAPEAPSPEEMCGPGFHVSRDAGGDVWVSYDDPREAVYQMGKAMLAERARAAASEQEMAAEVERLEGREKAERHARCAALEALEQIPADAIVPGGHVARAMAILQALSTPPRP